MSHLKISRFTTFLLLIFFVYSLSLIALPDLIVESINVSNSKPAVDENVTINVKVKNIGESTASSICKIFFEIDNGIKRLFVEPGSIYANQEYTFTQNVTFSEKGKFKVKVVADYYKKVAESDETNNEKEVEIEVGGSNLIFIQTPQNTSTIIFTVAPTSTSIFTLATDPNGPDLEIELLKTFPDQPIANRDVTIGVKVRNKGKSKSPGTWVHLSSPDLPSDLKIHIMPIAVSATYAGKVKTKFTESGNFKVTAKVDESSQILEADEGNNTKSINVNVRPEPKADLVIGNVTVEPASPVAKVQFKIKAVIKNIGKEKSKPCSLMINYGTGIRYSYFDVPAIGKGKSGVIEWTVREMEVKTYTYKLTIDGRNEVDESNENNNTKEKLIKVIDGR